MTKHRAPLPRPKDTPTTVSHPWRSTLRTLLTATLALLPLLPEITKAAGVETVPVVASTLVIAAAIHRVAVLPSVDAWLAKYLGIGSLPRTNYDEDKDTLQ